MIAVGSRVTCNPPPLDTDSDVLLLIDPACWSNLELNMKTIGFIHEGSDVSDSINNEAMAFQSFRNGEINFICTHDPEFFKRFVAATSVAKHLNLLSKTDRIALFQAVLYGNKFESFPT